MVNYPWFVNGRMIFADRSLSMQRFIEAVFDYDRLSKNNQKAFMLTRNSDTHVIELVEVSDLKLMIALQLFNEHNDNNSFPFNIKLSENSETLLLYAHQPLYITEYSEGFSYDISGVKTLFVGIDNNGIKRYSNTDYGIVFLNQDEYYNSGIYKFLFDKYNNSSRFYSEYIVQIIESSLITEESFNNFIRLSELANLNDLS